MRGRRSCSSRRSAVAADDAPAPRDDARDHDVARTEPALLRRSRHGARAGAREPRSPARSGRRSPGKRPFAPFSIRPRPPARVALHEPVQTTSIDVRYTLQCLVEACLPQPGGIALPKLQAHTRPSRRRPRDVRPQLATRRGRLACGGGRARGRPAALASTGRAAGGLVPPRCARSARRGAHARRRAARPRRVRARGARGHATAQAAARAGALPGRQLRTRPRARRAPRPRAARTTAAERSRCLARVLAFDPKRRPVGSRLRPPVSRGAARSRRRRASSSARRRDRANGGPSDDRRARSRSQTCAACSPLARRTTLIRTAAAVLLIALALAAVLLGRHPRQCVRRPSCRNARTASWCSICPRSISPDTYAPRIGATLRESHPSRAAGTASSCSRTPRTRRSRPGRPRKPLPPAARLLHVARRETRRASCRRSRRTRGRNSFSPRARRSRPGLELARGVIIDEAPDGEAGRAARERPRERSGRRPAGDERRARVPPRRDPARRRRAQPRHPVTSSSTGGSFAVGARTHRHGCAASEPRGPRAARSRSASRRSRSRSRCCSGLTSSGRRGSRGRAARSRKAPRETVAPDRRSARARARGSARAARGRRSNVARHDARGRPALPAVVGRRQPTGTPRRFSPFGRGPQRARRRRRPRAPGGASPAFLARPTARAGSRGRACAERPRRRLRTSPQAATPQRTPRRRSTCSGSWRSATRRADGARRRSSGASRRSTTPSGAIPGTTAAKYNLELLPSAPARGRGRAARAERRTGPAGQRTAGRGNRCSRGRGIDRHDEPHVPDAARRPAGAGRRAAARRARARGATGLGRARAASTGAAPRWHAARDDRRAGSRARAARARQVAQPAVRAPETADVRTDAPQAMFVLDTSRSMLASAEPGAPESPGPRATGRRPAAHRDLRRLRRRRHAHRPRASEPAADRRHRRRSTPPSSAPSGSSARLRRK